MLNRARHVIFRHSSRSSARVRTDTALSIAASCNDNRQLLNDCTPQISRSGRVLSIGRQPLPPAPAALTSIYLEAARLDRNNDP
jgi:hypothetical protein